MLSARLITIAAVFAAFILAGIWYRRRKKGSGPQHEALLGAAAAVAVFGAFAPFFLGRVWPEHGATLRVAGGFAAVVVCAVIYWRARRRPAMKESEAGEESGRAAHPGEERLLDEIEERMFEFNDEQGFKAESLLSELKACGASDNEAQITMAAAKAFNDEAGRLRANYGEAKRTISALTLVLILQVLAYLPRDMQIEQLIKWRQSHDALLDQLMGSRRSK